MVEAIRRCPPKEHAGDIAEDIFFSTVLNALNATMPSAFEASLFSVKSVFLEQLSNQPGAIDDIFTLDKVEIMDTIQKLWGKDNGLSLYNRMHRYDSNNESSFTIPLAFHQPWNGIAYSNCGFPIRDKSSRDNSECAHLYILSQPNIIEECKFLKYTYNHRGKAINK